MFRWGGREGRRKLVIQRGEKSIIIWISFRILSRGHKSANYGTNYGIRHSRRRAIGVSGVSYGVAEA